MQKIKCQCLCHKDPSVKHIQPCCKDGYVEFEFIGGDVDLKEVFEIGKLDGWNAGIFDAANDYDKTSDFGLLDTEYEQGFKEGYLEGFHEANQDSEYPLLPSF